MKGFFLFIIAILSFCVFVPISLAYGVYEKRLSFMIYATSIDQTINAICGNVLNQAMLNDKNKHKFGDMDKTISYNLGKNYEFNNLNRFGLFVRRFLNFIDKNHTEKAYNKKI